MTGTRVSRRPARIVIDVPDVISCADLAERLERHAPQVAPTGGDGCRLTLPEPAAKDELRALLGAVQEWARYWEIPNTPVRVGRRSYTLHSRRLAWTEL